ncbi:hypothetical protein WG922_13140 [Ramlibacter sp. AN1015]|uniref:hypothetical protein n=1 Tax=Ramlibacter sp. AN1015 TaxID=3133428 RepID=UPI0030BBEAA0
MNTQARVHCLESGQGLPLGGSGAGHVVLVEGTLLVQQPAVWLAGCYVRPAAVRLAAPAAWPRGSYVSCVAVGPSIVLVHGTAPLLSRERLRAAATWIRRLPKALGNDSGPTREPLAH